MVPAIELSGSALRENVRTWKHRTGTAVRAVVKADGYRFGLERIVRELHGSADGFVVSDADELERVRMRSDAPTATLQDRGPEHACRVADLHGIGNLARTDSLAALANRPDAPELIVRVGLRLAAGWSAIEIEDADAYASVLAASGMRVELWTHLSNPITERDDRERFDRFAARFRAKGVHIAGEDVASTFPAARGSIRNSSVRIGAGLFGAGQSANGSRLRCAIHVRARVVDRLTSRGELRSGYGDEPLAAGTALTVVRCGYSDGFPRVTKPYRKILSVGMQHATVLGTAPGEEFALLDEDDDLDELAAAAGVLPHQIVTGLGATFAGRPDFTPRLWS
ncbi:MAG TPA: alanine racemase [Candidatus Baltobacteraceae bacterium]|nr:alanine racemase [Candidatus Baltobacteraceae bacterium]